MVNIYKRRIHEIVIMNSERGGGGDRVYISDRNASKSILVDCNDVCLRYKINPTTTNRMYEYEHQRQRSLVERASSAD